MQQAIRGMGTQMLIFLCLKSFTQSVHITML